MLDLRKIDLAKQGLAKARAGIRHISYDDHEERKRLWEIETDSLVVKNVENLADCEEDMVDFVTLDEDYLVLAVEGKEGQVEAAEVGKLQGWICLTREDDGRLKKLAKRGLVDLVGKQTRVLEIAFARHPKAKSGQMASAVRVMLMLLHDQHGGDLVVTGYTDETNEASSRVLAACGFEKRGLVKYKRGAKTEDHFFVINWQSLKQKLGV